MADQQRIHPVQDMEAQHNTPTAPLVPQGASKSDNGEPTDQQHPPIRRTIPVMHSRPPKRRSCCCKCFCWTISLLLLLIVVIGAVIGILYLVFQPKLPKVSVDRLEITQFNLAADSSLDTTFDVTITVKNPNKKIGIYYEGGSYIGVYYTETKLSEGSLPKFYQGHENTTVLDLQMSGETQNATTLLTALQQQQLLTGNIPLDLNVNQPVRIKLGNLKLMKIKFKISCRLVVDSLSANNEIGIQSNSCKFKLRL
ncbi:LEA_2 domain-containing protein [Cephalotus follicularis]|uniref:LEA_2 domain-containing protein n=1 Tax=Cephalotus follicularis TaxID=3775 RepID=A0A1Q3B1A5_CEPFO|nr:LEA_2 domain-containing protein [Cephalotus follicularis]